MVANRIRFLLQHGLRTLRVVDCRHVVPTDTCRTLDWDAHLRQPVPESIYGFNSILLGAEVSTVGHRFENQISGAASRNTKKPVRERLIN